MSYNFVNYTSKKLKFKTNKQQRQQLFLCPIEEKIKLGVATPLKNLAKEKEMQIAILHTRMC